MTQNVPAGWYPDNADAALLRYWDGAQWTEHTHPAGGATAPAEASPEEQTASGAGQPAPQPESNAGAESAADQGEPGPAGYDPNADQGEPGPAGYDPNASGHTQQSSYGQQGAYDQQGTPTTAAGYDPNTGGYAQQAAYGQQGAYDQQPGQGHFPGPQGQPKSKTGVIVAIVAIVAILLAGLIYLGVRVFSGDTDNPESEPTEQETTDPGPDEEPADSTDDPAEGEQDPGSDPDTAADEDLDGSHIDGGRFAVGDIVEGEFEEGEAWVATMTVEEAGVTVLDAIDQGGDADLTLTVLDSSGTEIAANDDRGWRLIDLVGGEGFDPYLAPWLDAGEYTVMVGTWRDATPAHFELYTVQGEEIEPGDEQVVELDEFEYVGRALIVTEAGQYTIRATAEDRYAAIALFEANGDLHTLEDPYSDEAELTADLDEGHYLFIIADPGGDPDTFTFVVEGP